MAKTPIAKVTYLDATIWNETNEKNTAANDSNGLASVVKQKNHTDNEAGNLGDVWIIDVIQQHLCHFINTFQSFYAKP